MSSAYTLHFDLQRVRATVVLTVKAALETRYCKKPITLRSYEDFTHRHLRGRVLSLDCNRAESVQSVDTCPDAELQPAFRTRRLLQTIGVGLETQMHAKGGRVSCSRVPGREDSTSLFEG